MDALKNPRREAIYYPESDGEPMADHPLAGKAMIDSLHVLTDFFQGRLVHVACNNFVYRIEGNIKKRVSPDVYVVKGIGPEVRGSYGIWEAGPPCFVLEVLSLKTYKGDLGKKKRIYRRMGVREYALFDPFGKWLPGQSRMLRLGADGRYRRVRRGPRDRLSSRELGLELGVVDGDLRFFAEGAPLPTRDERAKLERARALHERQEKERAQAQAERERQEKDYERQEKERAIEAALLLTDELQRLRRQLEARSRDLPDTSS